MYTTEFSGSIVYFTSNLFGLDSVVVLTSVPFKSDVDKLFFVFFYLLLRHSLVFFGNEAKRYTFYKGPTLFQFNYSGFILTTCPFTFHQGKVRVTGEPPHVLVYTLQKHK